METEPRTTLDTRTGGTHTRTLARLAGALFVVTLGISAYLGYFSSNEKTETQSSVVTTTTTQAFVPKKTDFGTSTPANFPMTIPLEKGARVEQSFNLHYFAQNQLTFVFLSTKTVKENVALYSDFLKKQNWHISNTYASTTLSSLYATKGSQDINVTISEHTATSTKSQVSISVLNK